MVMIDSQNLLLLLLGIFLLITLPLLVVAARLGRVVRLLSRIENLNIRSLQRWG